MLVTIFNPMDVGEAMVRDSHALRETRRHHELPGS